MAAAALSIGHVEKWVEEFHRSKPRVEGNENFRPIPWKLGHRPQVHICCVLEKLMLYDVIFQSLFPQRQAHFL